MKNKINENHYRPSSMKISDLDKQDGTSRKEVADLRSKLPPGRPQKQTPHIFIPKSRNDRSTKIYYFTYAGVQKSTGQKNYRSACRVANEFKQQHDKEKIGGVSLLSLNIEVVLKFFLEWVRVHDEVNIQRSELRSRRLQSFWGDMKLIDIDPAIDSARYIDARRSADMNERSKSNNVIRDEIYYLNKALNLYCDAHPHENIPLISIEVPDGSKPRKVWLSRSEIARLCSAARGRIWDKATNDWKRHPVGSEKEGKLIIRNAAWRTRMRPILRIILLGVYSGSRLSVLLSATWSVSYERGHYDASIGVLVRSGLDEPVSSKRKPPARLPKQIRLLLGLWRINDALAFGHDEDGNAPTNIIQVGGKPIVGHFIDKWRLVRTAAGMENIIFHHMRHCCATWLVEGGANIQDGADYIGTTVRTFETTYLQYAPHFALEAALAMDPHPPNAA